MTKEEREEIEQKQSQAKKLRKMFKIYKGLILRKRKAANFKEPCMILLRRGARGEFYENVTTGMFDYVHSDGSDRKILLNREYHRMDYGDRDFLCYICHEDFAFPIPTGIEPALSSENFAIAIQKTLNDLDKLRAAEVKAKAMFFWKIAAGIALILMAIMVYKTVVPTPVTQIVQAGADYAVKNATIAANIIRT